MTPRTQRSDPTPAAPPPAVSRAAPWRRRALGVATAAGIVATLLVVARIGYWRMFTGFSPYDDEGCMLISVESFIQGHALYDDVFSMYGPLPILLKALLFAIAGVPVGHDAGRLIALGYWLAIAIGGAAVAWRLTGSIVAAWAAGLFAFHGLGAIVREPGHPQDLCALLLVLGVFVATFAGAERRRRVLVGLGVLAGCLLMTKINIFVFMLMGLGAVFLAFAERTSVVAAAIGLYGLALLAAPAVLMRDLLAQPAITSYALHTTLSLAAVLVLIFGRRWPGLFRLRDASWIGLGLLAAVGAVAAVVLGSGTSPHGLLAGIVLIPLRATGFMFTTPAFEASWPAPTAIIAGAVTWLWLERRGATADAIPLLLAAALRIGMAAWLLRWNPIFNTPPVVPLLAFAVPAAALLLLPHDRIRRGAGPAFGRCVLAALAVTESLWAYPVAGSQRAFAAMLPVLALIVSAADGLHDLAAVARGRSAPLAGIASRLVQVAVVAGLVIALRTQYAAVEHRFHDAQPLGLPGAQAIRLPEPAAINYREIVAALRQLPDTFYTMPGMYSLYFWSERASPTGLALTNWMYLLDDAQQERIVAALTERPDLRIVYSPRLIRFWMRGRPLPGAPLVRYISDNFALETPLTTAEIWARRAAHPGP